MRLEDLKEAAKTRAEGYSIHLNSSQSDWVVSMLEEAARLLRRNDGTETDAWLARLGGHHE
jgi:hypothetical protein